MTSRIVPTLFLLLLAATASAEVPFEPMIDLQRAVAAAEKEAATRAREQDRLRDDVRKALEQKAMAALVIAEQREQAGLFTTVQSTAALRRTRQALTEAVQRFTAQGDALEDAAARAARGELVPSVSDPIACDGPDCEPVSPRVHAAMALIGAVAPSFDSAKWQPDESLAVLAADAPSIARLRTAAETTATAADGMNATLRDLRQNLRDDAASMTGYAEVRTKADGARAAAAAAQEQLDRALRHYADVGRALKRAALLAGDGYILRPAKKQICHKDSCRPADGLEAAAFLVIGAADDMRSGLKAFRPHVAQGLDDRALFR
jgi:hypothetical protein